MEITGTIAEWEARTGLAFPDSGDVEHGIHGCMVRSMGEAVVTGAW
jgi:hypothetical protein